MKAKWFKILSVVTIVAIVAGTVFYLHEKNELHPKFAKGDPDAPSSEQALAGNGGEAERGPESAAEEEYAARAYPATDIPFQLTLNAVTAFKQVKARAVGQGKNVANQWTLIGPSTANYPGVLTFSGADYTTSGRITALAIAPNCSSKKCQLWVAAAGGGIWRTDSALAGSGASWKFISASFDTNAIGTLTYANGVLYAGTGEPNASGDSEAGMGIYKSTDGGNSWTKLAANTTVPSDTVDCSFLGAGILTAPAYSGPAFNGRSISSILVYGNTMYVGSTRGVRGISSVTGGGASLAPGLPPYGLWKSTDGGASFTLLNAQAVCLNPTLPGDAGVVQASFGSTRGVNHVELDPNYDDASNTTLYVAAFPQNNRLPLNTNGGVWRSTDGGTNWTQIKPALNSAQNTDRAEFAVTKLGNGDTRMYVGVGNAGAPAARFYRSDNVATGSPTFTDLTTAQNINYCTGQCWYDNLVVSPKGYPDVVYLAGSYDYATYGLTTNSRGVLFSTDAGVTFSDVSWDASTPPNGIHPDQHALVVSPSNPSLFFEGSDGGLMRSSGDFVDNSAQCAARGLSGDNLTFCQGLLWRVPSYLYSLNKGLSTLQFQSLSVNAFDPKNLMGGTQDNGTFETTGGSVVWPQIIYGDGGQSGFDVGNPALRFNTFFDRYTDANFQNGDPTKWVVISGPLFQDTSLFYKPIIPDPVVPSTIFVGERGIWRTQDWGGNQAYLEANCPEFTTAGNQPGCGDFVVLGGSNSASGPARLTGTYYGSDRTLGNVAAVERAPSDQTTLWAATTTGRVFISKNANAAAADVTYLRLDNLPSATAAPGRFVSSIYVDPSNPNHAWISYSGYSALTPSQPGHVFDVTFDSSTNDAIWVSLDGSGGSALPDLPITDLVYDSVTGDLYAASDFGVMRSTSSSPAWSVAGTGLPMVEVAGLTIVPSARVLYAATHGRSAWMLKLP